MRPCSGAEWLVSLRFALPKNAMNVIFCWLNPHFFNHFLYCKIWVINGLSRMIIHEELIVWCWAPYFLKGQDLSPHQVRAQQVRNEEELVQLSESQRIPECERIGKGKTGNQKPCLNMTYIYIWYYPRKIIKHHWNIPELFFWEKMGMDFGNALCWKTLLMAGCLHLGPCRSLRSLRASAMAGGPSGPSGALGWKHWSVVCGIHVLNHIPLISIYIYIKYSKVL